MGHETLPTGYLKCVEDYEPMIIQTVQILGAMAERKSFFTKFDVEEAFDEKRVEVSRHKEECLVAYLTRHGEKLTKRFRLPEESKEDDEC